MLLETRRLFFRQVADQAISTDGHFLSSACGLILSANVEILKIWISNSFFIKREFSWALSAAIITLPIAVTCRLATINRDCLLLVQGWCSAILTFWKAPHARHRCWWKMLKSAASPAISSKSFARRTGLWPSKCCRISPWRSLTGYG